MSNDMIGQLPLSKILGPAGTHARHLAGKDGPEWLAEWNKFNRRQPCWLRESVAKKAKASGLLIPYGYFSAITVTEDFDPNEWIKTQEKIWFHPDSVRWIVAAAEPVKAGTKFRKVSRSKLVILATGEMLKEACPKAVSKATNFCAWLKEKLSIQLNGENGELVTDSFTLFNVEGVNSEVFTVRVHWHSRDLRWLVNAWPLSSRWGAGYRFASKPI